MFASEEIFNALNVSAITSLLDTYTDSGSTSVPALFDAMVLPEDFTGSKSINFYINEPRNAALSFEVYVYTVNCRSDDYSGTNTTSRDIADAVINTINQEGNSEGGLSDYYTTCSVLATIPPADGEDNYNTPIEVTIKLR